MRRQPKRLHVLVCDDDVGCRISLIEIIRAAGLRAFEADRASEAIRVARSVPVDFGFFDYGLPDLDGTAAVRRLREESISFPYVLMSGQEVGSEPWMAEAGAVAFLPKPLDVEEIRRILQQFSETPGRWGGFGPGMKGA